MKVLIVIWVFGIGVFLGICIALMREQEVFSSGCVQGQTYIAKVWEKVQPSQGGVYNVEPKLCGYFYREM